MTAIKIGNRTIVKDSVPYLIAEIGVNHEGSIEKARELISLAHYGGADAVKFQTYKAETLASRNSPSYWNLDKEPTTSQYELFKKYDQFGEKEYELLAEDCRRIGIDFLSTPFDNRAVDFLAPMMSCFKIASADITNFPLIRRIASKGKPVILSTGASTLAEIDMAVNELKTNRCEQLALMHCILNYPTRDEDANLDMIIGLQRAYPDLLIGYSDHTLPDDAMLTLTAAYLKGAVIIEKHFTNDKSLKGNDHYHAMDVHDLKRLNSNIKRLSILNGSDHKHPIPSEMPSRNNARRSIVLKVSVKQDMPITEDAITCKRPAHGISPLYWDDVLDKKAACDLDEDHILRWEDIK